MSLIDGIPFLNFNQGTKTKLRNSAQFVEGLANALNHMRKFVRRQDCFTSKNFLGDILVLTAEALYNTAELIGVLGYLPQAREVRQYAAFTASLKETIEKVPGFKFPDNCAPGRLEKATIILSELASLTSEVGLEQLATSLGITFRLDLLP